MKLNHFRLLTLIVLIFPLVSYASHPPRGRYERCYRPVRVHRPAPVVVYSHPRPVVMVAPPPPTAYVNVVIAPRNNRISANEAIRNAKNAINAQRFDADRLRIAKNAANDLPLKSVDVLDILNMLNFESSRLDFAKFAYNRTVDTQNYSIVFEAFKYSSSINDLEDYIYNGR